MKRKNTDWINRPVDPTWIVHFHGPGGGAPGGPMYLDQREATEYNADPDLFAAKHLGFVSADEYREWRARHRSAPCFNHGGQS